MAGTHASSDNKNSLFADVFIGVFPVALLVYGYYSDLVRLKNGFISQVELIALYTKGITL